MQPLRIMNFIDVEVDVSIDEYGLALVVDGITYRDVAPDVTTLNRAVSLCNPFIFNRAHTNHVIGNIKYTQGDGLAKATLADEFVVQSMPISEAGNLKHLTEHAMISMEEYRQFRCAKSLLTLCEDNFNGELMPAFYLSNYNIMLKLETVKGTFIAIGCGFTIPTTGKAAFTFEESMLTVGSEALIQPGFVFMDYHVFKMLDNHIGTYIIKGSQ